MVYATKIISFFLFKKALKLLLCKFETRVCMILRVGEINIVFLPSFLVAKLKHTSIKQIYSYFFKFNLTHFPIITVEKNVFQNRVK